MTTFKPQKPLTVNEELEISDNGISRTSFEHNIPFKDLIFFKRCDHRRYNLAHKTVETQDTFRVKVTVSRSRAEQKSQTCRLDR